MKRPLIGLTTDRELSSRQTRLHTISEDYVQAVLRAGGAPLLIPTGFPTGDLPDLAEKLDGFILIGGGDVEISRARRAHEDCTCLEFHCCIEKIVV